MELDINLIDNIEIYPRTDKCDAWVQSFDYDGEEATEEHHKALDEDFELHEEVLEKGRI